ncbi:MAG: elongation factor 4 [Candidatus Brennerbacteria bacterium]|nr:elongation factor 4 [Candidatus Brennerbacteria bacterium]
MTSNIRNFCVIAHIDHGKSTLADRFLEITGTVEARRMKEQYLDQLELERERGITIKMAPVRMSYGLAPNAYILNLIDTPGHSDFSYEVSRALQAVEGAILLVDATQGIQAQTLANFRSAKAANLTLIGAVNKIDLFKDKNDERLKRAVGETAELLGVAEEEIFLVSGKTGEGASQLLDEIVKRVPHPKVGISNSQFLISKPARALIFDSFYDDHKGVVASVRVFDGEFNSDDEIHLLAAGVKSKIKELGIFTPEMKAVKKLAAGEVGYVATGIKNPEKIKIGDTIIVNPKSQAPNSKLALVGYKEPKPVVFVSFYPEDTDDHELLQKGLQKLRLNDSALTIEPDQNEVLGRGFKVGFLGRLHFEITSERLRREFGIETTNTFPSVVYKIKTKHDFGEIVKPEDLPPEFSAKGGEIWEPMVKIEIIVSPEHLNNLFPLWAMFRLTDIRNSNFGAHAKVTAEMPLAELISDFDDKLKSVTQGYGSFSYEPIDYRKADILRVDFLVAGEVVPGLSRFLPKASYETTARAMVKRLKELLPRRQFAQAVQASALGKIIAREDIPALKKDVTGYLYGGDRTRKMKLWAKQKKGKKRLKERGEAKIPPSVFRELLKK